VNRTKAAQLAAKQKKHNFWKHRINFIQLQNIPRQKALDTTIERSVPRSKVDTEDAKCSHLTHFSYF